MTTSRRVREATTTLGEEADPATVRRWACVADLIPGVSSAVMAGSSTSAGLNGW